MPPTRQHAPPQPEEEPAPVEANGAELTRRAANRAHAREKMQVVADEINRLLQQERQRQDKYKGKRT